MLPPNPRGHKRNKMIENIGKKVYVKGREGGEKEHCRHGSEKWRGGKGGVKGREGLQETENKQNQFPGGRELEETWTRKRRCRMRVQ